MQIAAESRLRYISFDISHRRLSSHHALLDDAELPNGRVLFLSLIDFSQYKILGSASLSPSHATERQAQMEYFISQRHICFRQIYTIERLRRAIYTLLYGLFAARYTHLFIIYGCDFGRMTPKMLAYNAYRHHY